MALATAATLVVKVVADTKQAVGGVDAVGKSASSWKDKVAGASRVAGAALLGLGGAAIIAGRAAAEDAQSQSVLAQSMKTSAGATADQVAATEDFIAKTALATGVADDQLRPAMGNLVRATGDVEKSQKAMNTALDISAATGVDVETVTKAMAKGYGGNESALNRLLPSVTKTAEKTKDFDKVMQAAAKTTKGAAAASADTAAGKMQRMQVAMDETTESLGAALLPAMGMLATVLATVAGLMQEHANVAQIAIGVVGALAATIVILNYAIKAYNVVQTISAALTKRDTAGKLTNKAVTFAMSAASKAAAAAQWLLNAAMSASPIGLVLIAVAALVAGFILLYKKSETFRNIVNKVWDAIKKAFDKLVGFIKKNWKTMLAVLTGPLGVAVLLVVKHWGKIKDTAKKVWDWIKSAYRTLKQILGDVFKGVADVAKNAWDKIKDGARAVKDLVITVWKAARDAVKTVLGNIKDAARTAWDAIKTAVRTVKDAIVSPFREAYAAVKGILTDIKNAATGIWGDITRAANGVGETLARPFKTMKNAVDGVVDAIQSLIGWIRNIDFPSPPGWMDKIPGVDLSSAAAPAPAVGRFAAPAVRATPSTRAATSGGGVTINVTGALDPEATARQIRRILAGHDRRVGLQTA